MTVAAFATRFAETLLDLVAPSRCAACGGDAPESVFCAACGEPETGRMASIQASVEGVPLLALGEYAPPLSTAIRRLKFEGHPELARPLARLLFDAVRELPLDRRDAWVPVPLHRARLVERGFNQAALLASALSSHSRASFAPLLLERGRDMEHQARLRRDARQENALGAFSVRSGFSGHRVILVDDVVTTGATARACLAALHERGIAVLAVVALAHASGRSC